MRPFATVRRPSRYGRILPGFLLLTSAAALSAYLVTRPPDVPFEKHMIDPGSSESAAIADINGDGRIDIVSGENWYEAPNWTKHRFRDILYTNNYIDDLSTLALDVNEDGHVDLITSGWFRQKLDWWENPGTPNGTWHDHVIETGYPIEFTFLVDLDNDGKANEILPQFGDVKAPLAWYERDHHGGIVKHVVSPRSYGHGIGVGDVNGDGRNDILTQNGWFEAPPDPRNGEWKFHPDWQLGDLGFIHVADVNGDGLPDLVTSMAHGYGIFWLEQKPGHFWEKHIIDDSWSQAHATTLIDLRAGPGGAAYGAHSSTLGILTGKRFMAHNGHDPGAQEPLGVYWYERLIVPSEKTPGKPTIEWVKHVIDYGGRTGGGIQIPVADLDGDGDLDFVVAGKSGLFWFENKTK